MPGYHGAGRSAEHQGGKNMQQVGKWAFIVGFGLAVIAAFVTQVSWMYWLLAVLGVVVGFLNITAEETKGFLIAAIALILSATSVQAIPLVGEIVTRIMANVVAFMSAAVLVVALKSLFESAKD
jgi:hypothetical protein